MHNTSLFNPQIGHDACGVGFLAKIDAAPCHDLVLHAVQALGNMAHRGGSGSGCSNPDGAGILFAMPHDFMKKIWQKQCSDFPEQFAVGQFFFPQSEELAVKLETIIQEVLIKHNFHVLAWRTVPINTECIESEEMKNSLPCFRQALITDMALNKLVPVDDFERRLFIARRNIEFEIAARLSLVPRDCYVVSLSSQSIIYKGLIHGGKIADFYVDLLDIDFKAHFAVFHERYSTNTTPAWHLAQPFRTLAHNGEINTLSSNLFNMKMYEALLSSPLLGENIRYLKPIISSQGSDSAALDNVFEFLYQSGRSLCHTAMMLVPEPFGASYIMGQGKRAFYEYHAAVMPAWDGPAAFVFTDGKLLGASLDRNALRPCRYTITKDGLIVLASECGVLNIPAKNILKRGSLRPRKMLMVDFEQKRVITDTECKNAVIYSAPYIRWIKEKGIRLTDFALPTRRYEQKNSLLQEQLLFGLSADEIDEVIKPMFQNAQEPVASMGMDTPLAVLSQRPQLLFSYFKQRFAQVTNPPIDSLRESSAMSLTLFLGSRKNLLEESPEHYALLRLSHPILRKEDMVRLQYSEKEAVKPAFLDILFDISEIDPYNLELDKDKAGYLLEKGLNRFLQEAKNALLGGATLLILSDKNAGRYSAPIPSLLAVSALQQYLLENNLCHLCSIIVDSGEIRDSMQIAQLLAFGASAVCPRLAYDTIEYLTNENTFSSQTALNGQMDININNYITAMQKGLMKACSRMGISVLRSFVGGQFFEAVGLGEELINKYFCGITSKIGGIGLEHIAVDTLARHLKAFFYANDRKSPEQYGLYKLRKNGEKHLWSAKAISSLHTAVRENDSFAYKLYAKESNEADTPVTLRSLFTLKAQHPISLEDVEPAESILRRFVGAAMSFGSISKEAHEAIAVAFNRIGSRSNCGEGGEKKERSVIYENGDCAKSKIRQIASGRFGVTAEYLHDAEEIQIKMAQGAKPGEGGQLPAHKVLPQIAEVRHTIAGVTLISPPPHHDIYSIEDLAQLIYDLRKINNHAKISVKIVSGTNVSTIASGVAKAGADIIVVSGHDGGTGAALRTAVSYVGLPWEIGLAETHAALLFNKFRSRVTLQTDGQLRTGKDLVIASILGAEEFAFGTSLLVAMGCCLLRVCHLGTCSVGIATQDENLCKKFKGSPDHVERFLRFLAEDFREEMARLGIRSVNELIGRTDLLSVDTHKFVDDNSSLLSNHYALWQNKLESLNFEKLLCPLSYTPSFSDRVHLCKENKLETEMNEKVLRELSAKRLAFYSGKINNTDRSIGTCLTARILDEFNARLPEKCVSVSLAGNAGQSFGAFLTKEIFLSLQGEANDYVGKGLSGGIIVVNPYHFEHDVFAEQTAIGNVALYGATKGELFAAGSAGERFAVRNSGAHAVVEGVGDYACEYMTGGIVVVLGQTGYNFGAGMTGGIAYVYDRSETFSMRCTMETFDIESVWQENDIKELRTLLEKHVRYTESALAKFILDNWQMQVSFFLKVIPLEYKKALARIKNTENCYAESISGTEEVYPLY